jgi:hypothetical protein
MGRMPDACVNKKKKTPHLLIIGCLRKQVREKKYYLARSGVMNVS